MKIIIYAVCILLYIPALVLFLLGKVFGVKGGVCNPHINPHDITKRGS